MARRKKDSGSTVGVKGFFRLQIVDKKTKKIVGDSGYFQNQITNYGLESCVVALPLKCAASLQASGMMLGSGVDPVASDTALNLSNTNYWSSFGQSTVIASLTARATQSFDGALGAATLINIGIFAASTGTLIAGKAFASSAITTDQDINATYELRYSTV